MKFGKVTQIGLLRGTDRENFEFFKKQDGGSRHLEKPHKSRYHNKGFREIWHDYAKWVC